MQGNRGVSDFEDRPELALQMGVHGVHLSKNHLQLLRQYENSSEPMP